MSFAQRVRALAEKLTREPAPVDPARFGDPIALKTGWSPAASGGANIRTHGLAEAVPGRLEYRPALGYTVIALLFVVVPVGAALAILGDYFTDDVRVDLPPLLPLGLCALFAVIGAAAVVHSRRGIVFDRGSGWFWKGRPPQGMPGPKETACRLTDIHALQLLRERVRSSKTSYWSYELNLVLEDGRRLNVVDHGDVKQLRLDAGRLAGFLGCKVWDATEPAASPGAGPAAAR